MNDLLERAKQLVELKQQAKAAKAETLNWPDMDEGEYNDDPWYSEHYGMTFAEYDAKVSEVVETWTALQNSASDMGVALMCEVEKVTDPEIKKSVLDVVRGSYA